MNIHPERYEYISTVLHSLCGRWKSGTWELEYSPRLTANLKALELDIVIFDRQQSGRGRISDFASLPVDVLEQIALIRRAFKSWQEGQTNRFGGGQ